jgi:hypothetical protein
MTGVVNYHVTDGGVLRIFVGNRLLATVEDGKNSDIFVEDVLYGMGYRWNTDGTISFIE